VDNPKVVALKVEASKVGAVKAPIPESLGLLMCEG
jgi:hypothetical protein